MNRRACTHALGLAALLGCVPAAAQVFPAAKDITSVVPSGGVAPWRQADGDVADPAQTGSLAAPRSSRTLADWYARQGSPLVALLVDRRLERMPDGWDGTSRLVIAGDHREGDRAATGTVTVGVERKAARGRQQDRHPWVKRLEEALVRELHRADVRLVDPTLAERALTARAQGGDTEYQSLKGSAGYILEMEVVPDGEAGGDARGSAVALIGALKNIVSGEIVASVRQPAGPGGVGQGTDALARAFVKRLMQTAMRA